MARENIEQDDWLDDRRTALIARLGCRFKADGMIVGARRLAGQYWRDGMKLIPLDVWEGGQYPDILFELRIAVRVDINDNRTDSNDRSAPFVYVDGTLERNAWYFQKKLQKSEAGKKSAEARRTKTGSAQPKPSVRPNETQSDTEQTRTTVRTDVNGAEPSYSSSFSDSLKNKENIRASAREESGVDQDARNKDFAACETAWLGTLAALGVERGFLRPHEEQVIWQLLGKFDPKTVAKSLTGARYETASKTFDPRAHVDIARAWKRWTAWADMADNPTLAASHVEAADNITEMLEKHLGGKQAVG